MGSSFLIALREGFEAALIVAIVLAFVKRSSRPDMVRAVWTGTASALAIATALGLVLHLTLDGLEGKARTNTFAAICIAACALLTWMIFWMRTHSRHLKKELEGKAGNAIAEGSVMGVAMVAFLAVLREGLETALFLISTTTSDSGGSVVVGTLLGLAVAVGLGVLVYQGSHLINIRRFFQVTGVLIISFAAGLVSKAVLFLEGNTDYGVYDVTRFSWLTQDKQVGRFLAGIFGWDPKPSWLQFGLYWAYMLPALVFFFWQPKTTPSVTKPPPAEAPAATPA